jgi:glutamyl/glutaminyl-tRNA synthetase
VIDLAAIPPNPVTRFAPSPTGRLHLGHVANAVWTWGLSARVGARVILRLEDHDRGRCRPEYEAAILEDLDWLGLEPDAASRRSFDGGPSAFRQSDNDPRHREALACLRTATAVYACRCSRRVIAEAGGPVPAGGERRYPGTCRAAGHPESAGAGIRAQLPEDEIHFDDLRLGPIQQTPAQQCGDLLLRDATGNWTYQFAVVVDDMIHGVNLVIRGEDLLSSTGRQILLGRLLGRIEPARFLHHPLIMSETGAKLSKRDGAPGLDELRQQGLEPAAVLGMAAHATGLIPTPESITPDELGDRFAAMVR